MTTTTHPPYRADIDGLRALAILSVVVFHAAPDLVPGGFVGVDIFFVISGFLISTIVFRNLEQGTFTFTDFYARRIKRIFPALALVLAAVAVFAWMALFTDEFSALGKHIAGGATYASNFVLWKESGYFDRFGELKPLLHLWSLGIEEQFYIIWPVLLVVLWKRVRHFPLVILVIGLASFTVNVMRVETHAVSTFYLPPSRFWELLGGAWLAYLQLFQPQTIGNVGTKSFFGESPRLRSNLQSLAGITLLLVAFVFLDRTLLYPGWWALLPTLGAFLLIAAGPQSWVNSRVLSHKALVFVGLISYPLYLWHWPLLSFVAILEQGGETASARFAAIVLAFALAWLTYRFIERPVRSSKSASTPIALFSSVAVVGVVGLLMYFQVLLPRSSQFGLEEFIAAAQELAYPGPRLVAVDEHGQIRRQGDNPATVMFFGDSNIEQYYPRIDKLVVEHPLLAKAVVFATNGGCPPMPNVKEDHHPGCSRLLDNAIAYAQRPEVDTIVIGASWSYYTWDQDAAFPYYYESEDFAAPMTDPRAVDLALNGLQSLLQQFADAHKRVVLILQTPTTDALDPHSMIGRSLGDLSFDIRSDAISGEALQASGSSIERRLRSIGRATGAQIVDPFEFLCSDGTCPIVTPSGKPIYKDARHLRPTFVREHLLYLDEFVVPPVERLLWPTDRQSRRGSNAEGRRFNGAGPDLADKDS